MYLTEEELKKYTCTLEKKFIKDFLEESNYKNNFNRLVNTTFYNSNELLDFLLDYPEVNDKSKQYFFFMCVNTFDDVPKVLYRKYKAKFGLATCGDNIFNSFGCSNSNLLLNCNGVKKSFGCNKCKFSDYLLYCTNIRHQKYMAFNKPVTKKRFDELCKLTPTELKKEPEYNEEIFTKINSLFKYMYKLKHDTNKRD